MRVIPFSNGSEFEWWYDRNCEQCRKNAIEGACKAEESLALGSVFGDCELKDVKDIGYTSISEEENGNFIRLFDECMNKTERKF